MNKYDIVYDEAIISYLELYCFLGAYFQYILSSPAEREHAVDEVAEFCTHSFIEKVITQIDDLLITHKTDDSQLMEWLHRITSTRHPKNALEARHDLRELQASLQEALAEDPQPQLVAQPH